MTLVEAIMQIEQKDTDNHVLACASHNKDADLICQELVKKVDKSKVLRMYAKSRDSNNVPRDLHVSAISFSFQLIKLEHFVNVFQQ